MIVRQSSAVFGTLLLPLVGAVILSIYGCASTGEISEKPAERPLREHEKDFDPKVYREPLPVDSVETDRPTLATEPEPERWVERTQKVMGYRIQLYSTTNIDEAQRALPRCSARIDSVGVESGRLDMSYDAPYYKIRMGDFLTKPPADSLRQVLQDYGITEAWVVRDKVLQVIRTRE